jgi:hypothetical protein
MPEPSKTGATIGEQVVGDATAQLTEINRRALDFTFGAQRAMLEETMIAGSEMFDRVRTELHLLSEFASKMAEAHSVDNIQTMGAECSRHQIDFLRRENQRLFKHGERMIETASKLLGNWRRT